MVAEAEIAEINGVYLVGLILLIVIAADLIPCFICLYIGTEKNLPPISSFLLGIVVRGRHNRHDVEDTQLCALP